LEYSVQKNYSFSKDDWNILELDIKINAQGLAFAAKREPKA
jgi:hypothetical protein